MHIHQRLQEQFPVRCKKEQKDAFLTWTKTQAEEIGYTAQIEANGKKGEHQNLVVGDSEKAQVIFTAHYDTPRSMFLPNLMMPKQPVLTILYAMLIVLPYLAIGLGVEELVVKWIGNETVGPLVFLVVYFGLFYFTVLKGPANAHNANDNTSGVASLLRIMETLPVSLRDKAAFVFFDNEEKGKLGSKAFAKAHPDIKKDKLVVNLDCVALGDHFITVANKKMLKMTEYELFQQAVPQNEKYAVHHFHSSEAMMNSDQSSFDKGVGIVACKKVPVIGYAAGRIHTKRDTVADTDNMDYVADWMVRLVEKL